MTDKSLAFSVYRHFGIPAAEWPAHWLIDAHNGTLSKRARRAYSGILASMH